MSQPSALGSSRFEICRASVRDTVFCPFTREWAVTPFFEALAASDVPTGQVAFVAYVDSDDQRLLQRVKERALALPFSTVIVQFSGWAPPAESTNSAARRIRHGVMREASKTLIGDGWLLLLEDDTLIPRDTFKRLSTTKVLLNADWVIGAEVGRWGTSRPAGVWKMTLKDDKPWRLDSLMPVPNRAEQADATGLYCVLTDAETYRSADFATWNNAIGHDVHATWRLTQTGKRLVVDWDVECVHLTQTDRITLADVTPYSRSLEKYDIETLATSVDAVKPEPVAAPVVKPIVYPVKLGKTVRFEGRDYLQGTFIDHPTALRMKQAGLLSDPRII